MSLIKKNKVSDNLADYSIAILGEAGVGKTTLMVDACTKEFGEDGYVIFNMGAEQGVDCINGASYIDVPDWKTLDSVIKELVAKRDTDYKDIKVIVYDTLDQLFEFGEKRVIEMWNRENIGDKNFRKCTSINSAYSGFGKGLDKNIEIIIDTITTLQAAGYRVWYTAHVKTKDIIDAVTGETYSQLTASMSQKYFNAIKDKMHCVGMAVIDRTIESEGTGRKNIVTKKEIEVNKVKEEKRKIVFRDDSYSIESKSRFAHIASEVPMSADAFLGAIHDAINAAGGGKVVKEKPVIKEEIKSEPVVEEIEEEEVIEEVNEELEDEAIQVEKEETMSKEEKIEKTRTLFKAANPATKKQVKALLNGGKLAVDMDDDVLDQIYDLVIAFDEEV